MERRRYAADTLLVVAFLVLVGWPGMPSQATALLRFANVGDPMQTLYDGLQKVHVIDEDATSCGLPRVTVVRDAWVVASRASSEDGASLESITVRGERSPFAVVAYDEDNLKIPLVLYIDIVGEGKITHVYGQGSFPGPCNVLRRHLHLRDQV